MRTLRRCRRGGEGLSLSGCGRAIRGKEMKILISKVYEGSAVRAEDQRGTTPNQTWWAPKFMSTPLHLEPLEPTLHGFVWWSLKFIKC